MGRVPFASLTHALDSALGVGRTEPRTGIDFTGEFCQKGKKSGCPKLTGVGLRAKNLAGFKVKVYAAGVYLDDKVAKDVLRKYSKVPSDKLEKDQSLFNKITSEKGMEKTVLLRFARTVDGEKIMSAFDERLKPALSGTAELEAFQGYFQGMKLEKGQALSFSAAHGVLTTNHNGKVLGSINSSKLCEVLFDAYLGADPVSHDLKKDVAAGVAQLLA